MSIFKFLLASLLFLAGLIGLAISLCGAAFTIGVAFQPGAASFLLLALPSLVIGGLIAVGCGRAVLRLYRAKPVDEEKDAHDPN